MCMVVSQAEFAWRQMGVYLGGSEGGVAEELTDGVDVGAIVKECGGA